MAESINYIGIGKSKPEVYHRGKTLSWVKDVLDSRSQAVVLNGVKSDKIAVSPGVPQACPWTNTLPSIYK